jgi:hypothetical protein
MTDSANCYLDGVLYYFMLVICRDHGLLLYARYYPAEQDAKGGIDAIFATLKRYLYALQNRGIDTATPRELFENVSSRPQQNFKTELFEIDRERIEELVNEPAHATAVGIFKRLKRFGDAVFDGKTLEISEYHGRVDLTIVFDGNFVPSVVTSASGLFASAGETTEDGADGEEMTTGEVEAALLERSEEDHQDSQVSFTNGTLTESHVNKETVTILPLTNTTVRRLPDGFKNDGRDSRTRGQKRNRSNIKTKQLIGGGAKAKTKQERVAKFKISKGSPAHPIETTSLYFQKSVQPPLAITTAVEPRIERGSKVVTENFLGESIIETEDTAVCWHCRKWFSPPTAKDGHTCDTKRQVHVDLTTYGLLYAVHCIKSNAHHTIQRGTAAESESSSVFLKNVRQSIHQHTLDDFVPMKFESGWARRPKRGAAKGATYIGPYRERIHEIFIAGEHDKQHRKSPMQIMEVLAQEHPNQIALPGYSEVSSFLGSLIQRAKKGKLDLPGMRAPPIPPYLAAEIESLDMLWETTGHMIGQPAVGLQFAKPFGEHGVFKGTLTAIDKETNLYHVKYEDGDEEDLEWFELATLLKQPGQPRPPRPRRHRRADIYDEMKSRHTTFLNGEPQVPNDFPSKSRFDSLLGKQRKARIDGPSVQLLR